MEDYIQFISRKNIELISLTSKMSGNDISKQEAIKLRKQYLIVLDNFVEMLGIMNNKLETAKKRTEEHLVMLRG